MRATFHVGLTSIAPTRGLLPTQNYQGTSSCITKDNGDIQNMSLAHTASDHGAAKVGVRRPITIHEQCAEVHRILNAVYHHMHGVMELIRQLPGSDNPEPILRRIEFWSDYTERLYRGLLHFVSGLLSRPEVRSRANAQLVQRAHLHLYCAIDVYLGIQQGLSRDLPNLAASSAQALPASAWTVANPDGRIDRIRLDLDLAFELLQDVLTCAVRPGPPRPRSTEVFVGDGPEWSGRRSSFTGMVARPSWPPRPCQCFVVSGECALVSFSDVGAFVSG
jgi:hypothetical protein